MLLYQIVNRVSELHTVEFSRDLGISVLVLIQSLVAQSL